MEEKNANYNYREVHVLVERIRKRMKDVEDLEELIRIKKRAYPWEKEY
jgi:hypothetical protein